MSPISTPVALNLKSWKFAAPVCAHETPLARSTTICTFAPTWVTSTVPNGAVPQPPVQWSDVKSNTIAWLTLGNAALAVINAAPTNPTRHEKLFIDDLHTQGLQTCGESRTPNHSSNIDGKARAIFWTL